jgi:hypothetical protein
MGLFLFLGLAVAWWRSLSVRTRQGQVAVVSRVGFARVRHHWFCDRYHPGFLVHVDPGWDRSRIRKEPEGAVEPKPLEFSTVGGTN